MLPNLRRPLCAALLAMLLAAMTVFSIRTQADTTASCNGVNVTLPFNDIAGNFFFCQIAAAFFSGLTNGTTATTYSPGDIVNREQMAAFTTRTLDQSLRRGSRRAALNQWGTPRDLDEDLAALAIGNLPVGIETDGINLYVANRNSGTVERINPLSFSITGTWDGMDEPIEMVVARSRIFVIGANGSLYSLNTASTTSSPLLTSALGDGLVDMVYDGSRLWITRNQAGNGAVHAVSFNPTTVQTITAGIDNPLGIVYDGSFIWVGDTGDTTLKKINPLTGAIVQTVTGVGLVRHLGFDGTNIWAPSTSPDKVSVVRASSGAIVATLTGNGLTFPTRVAFDGERVMVMNTSASAGSRGISLFHATSLAPITNLAASVTLDDVCSDGLNFWFVEATSPGRLRRF